MARLIYACRFEIPTSSGLAPVLIAYSNWIEGHYRNRRGLSGFSCDLGIDAHVLNLPPRHNILRNHYLSERGEVVRLQWTYPADADEGLEWRNEVRTGVFGDRCSVEHLISIESRRI